MEGQLHLQASEDALSLLSKLMAFDPRQRPTASAALAHKYFKNGPKPSEPGHLPKPPIRAHNPLKMQPQVLDHPS
jgi:serine/threonine protein kinase